MKELYKEVVRNIPEKLDQCVMSGSGWHPQFVAEASNPGFYEIFEDRDQMGQAECVCKRRLLNSQWEQGQISKLLVGIFFLCIVFAKFWATAKF